MKINDLKLKLFITKRTLGYTADYVEQVYKIYTGHSKVIHYRNGYPVFSLSSPALFSKPGANFFARILFRTLQNRNTPNMMSFAINDNCNAACEHCSFFEGVDDKKRKVISLDQKKDVIRQAQELGVSVINFVGGEPLLSSDFPELIKSVDKTLSTTLMFTNGLLLEKKAKELKDAGLDSVYVSIDSSDPKIHDAFRKREGLFEEAMKGIKKAKSLGLSVGISTCITPESYKNGELDAIVELGKKIGVHEIVVFDAMPTGRYRLRKDLVDNNEWVEELIKSTKKYNEDETYPGVLVWAYTNSHRSVGCSCGTSYFYVSPYGDIMSCDFNHAKFGSILKEPLYKIWDGLTSQIEFNRSKWGGCKIKDSQSRNSKLVDDGKGCSGC